MVVFFLLLPPLPPPLLPLFFKAGPIGRSGEFSKDETAGVMERGGETRGRKERSRAHFHTGLCFPGGRRRRRKDPRGAFPSLWHGVHRAAQQHRSLEFGAQGGTHSKVMVEARVMNLG